MRRATPVEAPSARAYEGGETELAQALETIDSLSAELTAVYSSSSWRFTAPLRALFKFIRKQKKIDRNTLPQPIEGASPASVADSSNYKKSRWSPDPATIAINPRAALSGPGAPYDPTSINLHWIVPDAATGSGGGHMNIFRQILFFEKMGHRQTIWLRPPWFHESAEEAKRTIQEFYQPIGDQVRVAFLPEDVSGIHGDAVIATDFWTVYPAMAMSRFRERFYFIQDYEADFHPRGSSYFLARNSYQFGLKALCAGPWLFRMMSKTFGAWARQWEFAFDPQHYFLSATVGVTEGNQQTRSPLVNSEMFNIAFYHRPSTPRRAVELAVATLHILHDRKMCFHVHLFGENILEIPVFDYTYHGALSPRELGVLYRSCDLGLVFSATNFSLIPIEMMACGLAVMEIDCECTHEVFPPGTLLRAPPDPIALADVMEEAVGSGKIRMDTVAAATSFISGLSWEKSCQTVAAAVLEGLTESVRDNIES
jgi:O-antigen biosynthesis protein